MKKTDRQLGMGRDITRRDFIHDISLVSLGLTLPAGALAEALSGNSASVDTYLPADPHRHARLSPRRLRGGACAGA